MLWLVSLLLNFVFIVSQSMWQRKYSQSSKLPETFPPALSYVLAVVPLSLIVGFIIPHKATWSGGLVVLLAIEGVFIGVFNWFMFMALRRLPIAKFEMIFQLYAVVVIFLGWALLGEKLSFIQICGGIMLFAAAYIAISAPVENAAQIHDRATKSGVLIALAAALTLGIGLVAEKAALKHMDVGAYYIFGFPLQGLTLVILACKDLSIKTYRQITINDIKYSTFMGVQSALVGFTYIVAIQLSHNISLVTILSSFTLPLTVLAGYFFLHEKDNMNRLWIASILGVIGFIVAAL